MGGKPARLEAAGTSAQGAAAPRQPPPVCRDKTVDNLIFAQGMHFPAAARPQQQGNALEQ